MHTLIKLQLITLLISLLIPITVLADIFSPSHSCSKPYKPYQFRDQYEVDRFNSEVKQFKKCINDFVEEQNEASKKHLQAGQDAIDDWNSYVNRELR